MRYAWRTVLLAASVLSIVICGIVLRKQGAMDPSAWATVAAALAVLAAVTSAWTGQRVLEMQEDALEPSLLPAIDLRSRTNLAQFKITNYGGSHAYAVTIKWDRPLPSLNGTVQLGETPISMIPKRGERLGPHQLVPRIHQQEHRHDVHRDHQLQEQPRQAVLGEVHSHSGTRAKRHGAGH